MSARRNLKLITPYQICALEGVTHGLYFLWLTAHRGFSPLAATAAIAVGELSLLAFEIPTGVFADRLGPRRSLMLGSLCQVIGMILFWQARVFPALLAGAIAVALGDAFRHGADEALTYRSCAAIGEAESFTRRLAAIEGKAFAAVVVATALGGVLAGRVSFHLAWALDVALASAGLVISLAMTELPATPGEPDSEEEGSLQSLLAALGARLPWAIIVPVSVVVTLGGVGEMLTQTTPREGMGAEIVALTIAGAMALEATGAALVARGKVPVRARTLDLLTVATLVAVMVAAFVPHGAMVGLAVIFVAAGMARPIRSGLVQAAARDEERATAASVSGLTDMLGTTMGLPLAAWLSGHLSLRATAAILGVISVIVWAIAARASRWNELPAVAAGEEAGEEEGGDRSR